MRRETDGEKRPEEPGVHAEGHDADLRRLGVIQRGQIR